MYLLLLLLIVVVNSQCISEEYRLKMIYIVPKNHQPRDNIQLMTKNIAQRILVYFYEQLGVTLNADYPLLDIVYTNNTEAEILDGYQSADQNAIKHLQIIVNNRYSRNKIMRSIFFGMSEVDIGGVLGNGAGGFAHVGIEFLDLYEALFSEAILMVALHEIGHALGLPHLAWNVICAQTRGVPVEYSEPNLMQGLFYNFSPNPPLFPIQKEMLLIPTSVLSRCLHYAGYNHPINFLKNRRVCINPIDIDNNNRIGLSDLALILTSWKCRSEEWKCKADLNCDYEVNLIDLSILLVNWC